MWRINESFPLTILSVETCTCGRRQGQSFAFKPDSDSDSEDTISKHKKKSDVKADAKILPCVVGRTLGGDLPLRQGADGWASRASASL